MVSVEPIITETAFDTKLSTPSAENISLARAKEPLPDTGRSRAKLSNSDGMLRRFVTGDNSRDIRSIVPEALNTPMAAISPIRGVAMENTAENPSFAPVVNVSKILIRFINPEHMIIHTSKGMAYTDMVFITFYPSLT